MKPIINSLKILTLLSFVLFFQGCKDDDTSLPTLEASFTHTIDQDTGKVTFINTSSNADSYSWDFGDGTTSTEINPMKIYATGTYTVVLTATNVAGASDTFEDQISINIPIPMSLPFNFDGANVVYNSTVFIGASFAIVDNPAPGGSNATASKVGAITNSGVNWEGVFFDLANAIDLSVDMTIQMDVWSDVALPVLMKLEEGTAAPVEVTANHTGSGWETLVFTFTSADSYSRMTIFIDGPGTSAGTFYIDNVRQTSTVDTTAPVITLVGANPLNLNVGDTYTDPGATAMDNLDGDITAAIVVGGDTVDTSTAGTYNVTYNVMDAAGNAATEVTRTVEVTAPPTAPTAGAPVPTHDAANVTSVYSDSYTDIGTNYDPNWGQSGHTQVNTTFDPGDGNNTLAYPNFNYQGTEVAGPVDLSTMEFLHVDIWVMAGTDRLVKVSPINAGTGPGEILVEVPLTPGSWNSVDIPKSDFTGMTWDAIVQMKFDGQFNGDGSANTAPYDVYLDNIYFHKTASTACTDTMLEVPINFDCAGIDYASKQTGDVGFTIIDNPDLSGANPTASKVAETVWDNNQVWENMFLALDSPLDLSAGSTVKIKMWSNSTQPVKLKLEGGVGGALNIELDQNHAGTGWEELTFSFASTDAYSNLVLFVNGGGATTGTFYFDDIVQASSGGGGGTLLTLPADFENGEVFSKTFEGGVIGSNAANPSATGINTSANVYKFEKPVGTEWYGGMENDFDPLGLTSGQDFVIKVKMYGTKGNVPVQLQLNRNPTIGSQPNYSNIQTSGPANTWTELTFTITAPTFDDPALYDTIVIIPDFDNTNNPTSSTEIYYVDDIVLQ